MKQMKTMGLAMVLAHGMGAMGQATAPRPQTQAPPAATAGGTGAPGAQAGATTGNAFGPANPKNFTASSPTTDEVNSFLKVLWGYDENRVWQVAGILKTPAPGVAKIVVLVADKRQAGKAMQTVFYTTPDGKHAIADNVIDFGATPFAETRKTLQERANGPARGAKGNELLLVEFADLQCPQCSESQDKMDKLVQDFPEARVVYESYPIGTGRPFDMRAALDGVCVRKSKGDAAFFTYAQAVYGKQAGLTEQSAEEVLKGAIVAAGADSAAVSTCAESPEAKAEVDASLKLGEDVGVGITPALSVNGRMLPIAQIPYETLKQMVAFQAGLDGIKVRLQPTLSTLK
ncbi:MAG TPA: thioredoxin domain-containing protein [Acidobacteriaceae bacterium]|jgi:protein-disulfide isomerase|nr:thioredoxin domain-containing protein [Acidobacteriaceae bacterium]